MNINNKFFVEFDIYFTSAAERIKEQLYNICDKFEISKIREGVYHFKLYVDDKKALTEVNKIVSLIYCNVYKNQNYIDYKAGC